MDPTSAYNSNASFLKMRELDDEDHTAKVVSKIAILAFWISVVLCNLYLVWLTYRDHTRRQERLEAEDELEDDEADNENWNQTTNVHLIAKKLAGMPLHAKLAYYNKLFDKLGNQIELTKEQIIVVGATTTTRDGTETTTKTKNTSSWDDMPEDIEKGTARDSTVPSLSQRQDNNEGGTGLSDFSNEEETLPLMIYLSPSTVHPCGEPLTCASRSTTTTTTTASNNDTTKNNDHKNNLTTTTTRNIDGQCVICLETFRAGETIVYNSNTCQKQKQERIRTQTLHRGDHDNTNTNSNGNGSDPPALPIEPTLGSGGSGSGSGCSHVYHKACLVQYLSNRIISPKGLRDGEADTPTCPTCREPYVELLSILSVVNDNDKDKDKDKDKDNGDCHNNNDDSETLSVTHRMDDSEDSDSSSSGHDFEV